ncbi:MFS transporter [Thermococcus aciditolerans]|uniref:MFS transporter n=1 Tax=Thermococcus aciditolerans TaxID=2598455 RepID=A0A5C0SLV0_9EURY|nr:MFS transporter [Thermococcus aciditolerans]QEK15383.1 MFS transporter [Thermococcus aciditolerans]
MMLNRNFWLYAVGRFVSQIGWAVQNVALPLYVLDTTKSGAMMSVFLMAGMIPSLVLSPIAGVVGDRYNRKTIMVWLDIARGALLLGIVLSGLLSLNALLAVQVLMSIMGTFFGTATSAMFADLVEKEELAKATSTVQSLSIAARIAGPLVGGVIYAFGGITLAILINGLSFLGSGLFEMLIEYKWQTKKLKHLGEVKDDLLEGVAFLKDNKPLKLIMGYALMINFLLTPALTVVLPYVYRVSIGFNSEKFGALQTAFMVGMLLGNGIILAKLGNKAEKLLFKMLFIEVGLFIVLALLVSPAVAFGTSTLFSIFIGMNIVWGASNALVNVPFFTKMQKLVPSELRGRVFSVFELLAQALVPIGVAIAGIALEYFTPYSLLMASGVAGFAVTLYYFLRHKKAIINVGTEIDASRA